MTFGKKQFYFYGALLAFVSSISLSSATDRYPSPPLKRPCEPAHGLGDPEVKDAWHLKAINAAEAWKYGKGDKKTFFALVDSGIDYNNPDLASNIVWNEREWPADGKDSDHNGFVDDVIGWDFVKDGNLPFDRSGHGTFLATIAASVEDNGVGTVGVCPKCGILPVRFMNWEGLGDTEDAVKAIDYAVKMNAKVINFSFSAEGYDGDLKKSIEAAGAKDILVVVAASNDGENDDRVDTYPAKYNLPNQLTVAATDQNGDLWEDSNWGHTTVHLAAPGTEMLGFWEGKWDKTGAGTSDAAALVSGAATLLRSIAPELSAVQVKEIFMATVKKYPKLENKLVSGGVLDLGAAVDCVKVNHLSCLGKREREKVKNKN